ncbi:MAG TPA: AAA family ATPase, partial [Candidatus Methylomirabilis sp.]|nr:AAA family ATPase [Candidatus Methylomirabilis sp.]
MALWAFYEFRVKEEGVCFVGAKKPSQMFLAVGQAGSTGGASVPLLEGQNYRELVTSAGFAAKVAARFNPGQPHLGPGDIAARLRADFKEPDLIKVRGVDKDPAIAVRVANAACETLVDLNKRDLRNELEAQIKSEQSLLADAGKEVVKSNEVLRTYMRGQGLLNMDFNSGSSDLFRALEVISQQEVARASAEASLRVAKDRLNELQVQQGAPLNTLSFPVEDPAVATLRSQLEHVRTKLWDAQRQFTDAHPVVKDLKAQIERLKQELDNQIRTGRAAREFRPSPEYEMAIGRKIVETKQEILRQEANIAARSHVIAEHRRALGTVPGQRAEVERLKFAVTAAQDRYQTLLRKLDETRVSLDSIQGTLSIIQVASAPESPDTFRWVLIAPLLLIGLPLGVGLLVDFLDDTVRNPVALGRRVGLSCLALVPKARQIRSTSTLANGSSGDGLEAFQILRSGLRYALGDLGPRRIAVVGPRQGVGRSTVLLHLARELVNDRMRVIIVDADLRSKRMEPMLGSKNRGGLVEVLMGERTLDEVLCRTPFNALLLPAMAAGRRAVPPNAELIFRRRQLETILRDLSERADVVLFDTAAMLEFADTLELLPHMNGVILVADARSELADIQQCVDLLQTFEARSLGFVMNKVR